MWGQEWRRVARKIFPQFATRVRQPLPHTDHGGYFSDCAQNWLHISWHIQTIYCMAGNAGFYEKRRIGGGGHAGNLADSAQSLRLFKLARANYPLEHHGRQIPYLDLPSQIRSVRSEIDARSHMHSTTARSAPGRTWPNLKKTSPNSTARSTRSDSVMLVRECQKATDRAAKIVCIQRIPPCLPVAAWQLIAYQPSTFANELVFNPHSSKIYSGRHVANQVRIAGFLPSISRF
jgi:hypothetical protein